ncbi:MAG: hypothetical protein ABIK28_05545, partial [Planctomycetota bacterium]
LMGYMTWAPLDEVRALSIKTARDDIVRHDNISVTLRYGDGSLGTLIYTSLGDPACSKERFELFGGGRVAVLDNFRKLTVMSDGCRTVHRHFRQQKGHKEELLAFVQSIMTGEAEPISFDDICSTTEATFRIAESLQRGNGRI